ncbi:hypothetical protein HYFRA_00003474 [Hymenoscyphus fraxineus]|uniref:2EXR domain-containing protein n=1 Tax=Hymenoscyphus fraxineus TaxID=746836 RepID=A0A9N9PRM9_9HELO|nr:hypothetical protein HYFRA_00003474 [Hymenoscyphus fraxineus]
MAPEAFETQLSYRKRILNHFRKASPEEPTFHLFSKHLPHIRRKIWHFAHQNSERIVEVTTWPGTFGFGIYDRDSFTPYHIAMRWSAVVLPSSIYGVWNGWEARVNQEAVLLHVCTESRAAILPFYTTPFNNQHVRSRANKTKQTQNFMVCWENDTLLINLKVFQQRGDNLEMIFCQLFGSTYASSRNANSITEGLRYLAGNHEFFISLFRHPTTLPKFTRFFERFSNLELKYVPLYLQNRSGTKLLGFEERFIVKGSWDAKFRGDFFKFFLQFYQKGQHRALDKLCKGNNGGAEYIQSRKKVGYYQYESSRYVPRILKVGIRRRERHLLHKRYQLREHNPCLAFKLFPNLPTELRILIWQFALPGRRFIMITKPPVWDDYTECDQTMTLMRLNDISYWHPVAIERAPAPFFANQEARSIVQKSYIPLKSNDGFGAAYFNPKLDVICFDHNPYHDGNILDGFLKCVPKDVLEQITSIHLNLFGKYHRNGYRAVGHQSLKKLIDSLPSLQEILSRTMYNDRSPVSHAPMIGFEDYENTRWMKPKVHAWLQGLEQWIPQLAKLVRHGYPIHDTSFHVFWDHQVAPRVT